MVFTKKSWYSSNKEFLINSNFPKEYISPSSLVLKNGDTLHHYRIQKYALQENKKDTVFLTLLAGITDDDQLISIADVNRNELLTDDPVYKYSITSASASELPKVAIPGVRLKDRFGRERNYNLQVSFTPDIFTNNLALKSLDLVKTNIQINFYPIYYYGADFIIDKTKYEIALIPFPISFDYFDLDGEYKPNFCSIRVFKKMQAPKVDSSIFMANLRPLIDKQGKYYQLSIPVGSHSLVINDFSFPGKIMNISLQDPQPMHASNMLDVLKSASSRLDTLLNTDKKLLVEFTGTWCQPCRAIVPQLKELYQQYKSKVELVSVFVEKDQDSYQRYADKNNMPWKKYLELSDGKASDLNQSLGIKVFPTFLLIDEKGNVLRSAEGAEGLMQLVKLF